MQSDNAKKPCRQADQVTPASRVLCCRVEASGLPPRGTEWQDIRKLDWMQGDGERKSFTHKQLAVHLRQQHNSVAGDA